MKIRILSVIIMALVISGCACRPLKYKSCEELREEMIRKSVEKNDIHNKPLFLWACPSDEN